MPPGSLLPFNKTSNVGLNCPHTIPRIPCYKFCDSTDINWFAEIYSRDQALSTSVLTT